MLSNYRSIKTALLISFVAMCQLSVQVQAEEYTADWDSLKNYQVPEWYQDAKFGIWPIWGVCSVPAYRGDHFAE